MSDNDTQCDGGADGIRAERRRLSASFACATLDRVRPKVQPEREKRERCRAHSGELLYTELPAAPSSEGVARGIAIRLLNGLRLASMSTNVTVRDTLCERYSEQGRTVYD